MREPKSICAAENGTDIPRRTDVIQDDGALSSRFQRVDAAGQTLGPGDQLSADAMNDTCLSHTDRATCANRMSHHERVTESTRITFPDLVAVIWHRVIIHATISACIGLFRNSS